MWPVVALAAVGLAAVTFWGGWSYYALPRAARPWEVLHRALSPSGDWGHGIGVAGSALMLLNLLYLARRRWSRLSRLGPVPAWLAFHVAAGLGGVALVIAHSALLLQNPIAQVSIFAAGVVLVTGVVGRWIYGFVRHRADGEAADEGELVAELRERLAQVPEALRTDAELTERALARCLPPRVDGPLAAALSMPRAPLAAVRMWRAVTAERRRLRAARTVGEADIALAAARDAVALRRRARRQAAFKRLVGSWRGLHRVATFVLILTLVAHVITVMSFGIR